MSEPSAEFCLAQCLALLTQAHTHAVQAMHALGKLPPGITVRRAPPSTVDVAVSVNVLRDALHELVSTADALHNWPESEERDERAERLRRVIYWLERVELT